MKTGDLIAVLAAAPPRRSNFGLLDRLAVAAGLAALAACIGFLVIVGPRPDLGTALGDPRVVFKFVFAAGCAASGFVLCRRAARPDAPVPLWPLALPLLLALAGSIAEMGLTPKADWLRALVGMTPLRCVLVIVATSAVPVLAVLATLRSGAPRSPAVAGAAAGLLGGAIGSAVFALECPNDSALFVSVWYVLAIGIAGCAGALAGRRLLAW